MKPRACQAAAANAVLDAIRRGEDGAVRMPTRSGKSIAMGLVLRRIPERRVYVVTSRTMLVDDLCMTFWRLLDPGALAYSAADKERETKAVRRAVRASEVIGRWDGHRQQTARVTVTTYPSLLALIEAHGLPDILICDEAHRTKGPIRKLVEQVPLRYGFSATLHGRDDRDGLPFSRVLYELGYDEAVAQGVIVPWRPLWCAGQPEQGEETERALRAALSLITAEGGPDHIGPILFTAPNLTTAAWMAEQIRAHGWTSEAAIPRKKGGEGLTRVGLRRLLRRFAQGDPQTLVTVDWLAEGVTIPALRAVALCAQPRGRNHLCQVAGRVMGTCAPDRWGEKREALIIDPCAILVRYRLEHPAALGRPPERPRSVKRATQETVAELAELPYAVQVAALDRWSLGLLDRVERWSGQRARRLGIGERAMAADQADQDRVRRLLGAVRWVEGETHREAIKALAEAPTVARGVLHDLGWALTLVRDGIEQRKRAGGRAWGPGWQVPTAGLEAPYKASVKINDVHPLDGARRG